jgi:uncharacterized protein with GYD domain
MRKRLHKYYNQMGEYDFIRLMNTPGKFVGQFFRCIMGIRL